MGAQGALVTGWHRIFMMAVGCGQGPCGFGLVAGLQDKGRLYRGMEWGRLHTVMYVLRVRGIIVGWPGQVMMQHFDS